MTAKDDYKEFIDNSDYVAFDIYDTAVVRPFRRPTDLFRYVEKMTGREGFASNRMVAEKKARKRLKKEVTLNEIYSFMPEGLRDLKEKETETEIALARKDGEFVAAHEYTRRAGKKILMVSDMYLPLDVISRILSKLEIGYDWLYISSDRGCTKSDGALYDLIMVERGITDPRRLLMVGDNRISDCTVPRKKGIQTYRWKPLLERYCKEHSAEARFGNQGIDESVLMGADMLMWQARMGKGYWNDLGLRFGGPMALQFVLHIVDNMPEDTDRILFLSRDAYNIWRLYGEVCGRLGIEPVSSSYLHISRMFVKLFRFEDASNKDSLESVFEYLFATGRADALGIPRSTGVAEYARIFKERREEVLTTVSEAKERYLQYLRSQTKGCESILLVDTTTMMYTAQRFLAEYLPKVAGCYYAVTRGSDLPHTTYCDRSRDRFTSSLVNFAEYCFASGEPPLFDVDGSGNEIQTKVLPRTSRHSKQAPMILDGERQYCEFMCNLYRSPPRVSHEIVDGWCKILFSREGGRPRPNELSGAMWAVNTQHTEFLHVLLRSKDVARIGVMRASALVRKLGKP